MPLPPENAVELQLRSVTGVTRGEIPQDALDAVEGFHLRLSRAADLSLLGRLRNLRWITIASPLDIDLSHLPASLTDVTVEAPVTDITRLGALPRLKSVRLAQPRLSGLAPIAHLWNVDVQPAEGYTATEPAAPSDDPIAEYPDADWKRQAELTPQLVATREPEAIQLLIRHTTIDDTVTVTGLLMRDGAVLPFPDNAWGIPRTAHLKAALNHVWRDLAGYAPQFMAAMHARTVGLALLADGRLAYVAWLRNADREPPRRQPWQHNHEYDPHAPIAITLGAPPKADGDAPAPVKELWTVHRHLGRIGGTADVPIDDVPYIQPGRYLMSIGSADSEEYVLDLEVRDLAGDPTVATWAFKDGEIGDNRQFWDWFDDDATRLTFL